MGRRRREQAQDQAAGENASSAHRSCRWRQLSAGARLQIRLHDGKRVVAEFNHDQTVGDIRAFINTSNPEMATVVYNLATTFPRKVNAPI